jgi:SAM-dependent methyltransferase
MTNPFADVMRLVNGYQVSQALHVAAVLGIADLLAAGPRDSDDLARATATHSPTLYRLLRALAAVGVFHEDAGGRFSLLPMGECLRRDTAGPAGPWAAFIGRPYIWQPWSHLLHSVQTGETAFSSLYGGDVWEYRAAHPEEGAIFDAAMTALSRDVAAGVAAAYDFAPFARAVDVGGGQGALIGGILATNPALHGAVFDQPHVVARARPELDRLGVADRCEVIGGSFFDEVPPGDLLLLKAILHDWDDAHAGAILRSCRRAVAPGGRLLVIERVLAAPNEGAEAKFADLDMLVGAGGKERTTEEFAALFAAAGFELAQILPTGTRMAIVEGVCA